MVGTPATDLNILARCWATTPQPIPSTSVRWRSRRSPWDRTTQTLRRTTTIWRMATASRENTAEAEPLYRRSLAIREEALGPEHPDVAMSLNNLAVLYREQGQYPQAEPLFQRTLEVLEKSLGPEHPNVAATLENYAELLRKTNREAEAERLEARAKAIRAKHAAKNPKK